MGTAVGSAAEHERIVEQATLPRGLGQRSQTLHEVAELLGVPALPFDVVAERDRVLTLGVRVAVMQVVVPEPSHDRGRGGHAPLE